jgi:hypothetical protein
MIKGTFRLASELIDVVVKGNDIMFVDVHTNTITSINGLKISYNGVIKEFPELEDNDNWKKIALERFKEHIKSFKLEREKLDYIKVELKNHGYEPLFIQQAGHRTKKFK